MRRRGVGFSTYWASIVDDEIKLKSESRRELRKY
jgi:hypothetical protein